MINKTYSDKLMLKVYNEMIDDKSDRRLTVDELYVYSILCMHVHTDDNRTMPTSINMIHYLSHIKFVANEKNNKMRIKKSLLGLINKGYLVIQDDDITTQDIGNNTFITLMVNEELENKFEPLYFNEFRFFSNPSELFIYIITKRFCGFSDGFKSSYNRWAKLMNVSDKTASSRLNDAESRGLIEIARGAYQDYNKQDINLYTHVDLMQIEDTEDVDEAEQEESEPVVHNKVVTFGDNPKRKGKPLNPEQEAKRLFG